MRPSLRLTFLPAAVALLAGAPLARAETVVVDGQVIVRASDLPRPARGLTMQQVEARFGAPATRHEAVGEPPITRWDYAGYSVFFERDRVVDTVVAGG